MNEIIINENMDYNVNQKVPPSRRYKCANCGSKGRRGNLTSQRLATPICPACLKTQSKLDGWADHYHSRLVEARKLGYLPDDFNF